MSLVLPLAVNRLDEAQAFDSYGILVAFFAFLNCLANGIYRVGGRQC